MTRGAAGIQTWPIDLEIAPEGDVVVVGSSSTSVDVGGEGDVWIARYAP